MLPPLPNPLVFFLGSESAIFIYFESVAKQRLQNSSPIRAPITETCPKNRKTADVSTAEKQLNIVAEQSAIAPQQ